MVELDFSKKYILHSFETLSTLDLNGRIVNIETFSNTGSSIIIRDATSQEAISLFSKVYALKHLKLYKNHCYPDE